PREGVVDQLIGRVAALGRLGRFREDRVQRPGLRAHSGRVLTGRPFFGGRLAPVRGQRCGLPLAEPRQGRGGGGGRLPAAFGAGRVPAALGEGRAQAHEGTCDPGGRAAGGRGRQEDGRGRGSRGAAGEQGRHEGPVGGGPVGLWGRGGGEIVEAVGRFGLPATPLEGRAVGQGGAGEGDGRCRPCPEVEGEGVG